MGLPTALQPRGAEGVGLTQSRVRSVTAGVGTGRILQSRLRESSGKIGAYARIDAHMKHSVHLRSQEPQEACYTDEDL